MWRKSLFRSRFCLITTVFNWRLLIAVFFSLFCLNFSKQFTQLLFATVSLCFRGEGRVSFGNIKSMLKLKFVLQLFARIFDRAFTLRYVCVSKFEFCVAPFWTGTEVSLILFSFVLCLCVWLDAGYASLLKECDPLKITTKLTRERFERKGDDDDDGSPIWT